MKRAGNSVIFGLGLAADVVLKKGKVIELLIPASTARTAMPVFSEVI